MVSHQALQLGKDRERRSVPALETAFFSASSKMETMYLGKLN